MDAKDFCRLVAANVANLELIVGQLRSAQERAARESAEREALVREVDLHDRRKGVRWESEFSALAVGRGFAVERPTDSKHDLRVAGKRVQCKRLDSSTAICSTPIVGRKYRGYSRDDWDVLALKKPEGVLIIPVDALVLEDGVRVRNHVSFDAFKQWRDCWSVFGDGYAAPVAPSQKFLW